MIELHSAGGKVRLHVEPALEPGARVIPTPAQAHYLLHVMRARVGDRVRLFNGRDGEWLGLIAESTRRGCVLSCEQQTREQTEDGDLWLIFAPIKKTPADYVAQKATELGVSVLQPVITRRTIVHRVNVERIRANAVEAAEQSDRLTVPEIWAPMNLPEFLEKWPKERKLLFCDEGGAPPILDALKQIQSESWAVLTGPEGGFDDEERAMIRALPSTIAVSLGRRILRADTAALAALSILQAQCAKG